MKFNYDKLKIGDIIYFEFEDHCTDMPAWARKDDWHHSICTVQAIGFVAAVGKKYLTVVQLIQKDLMVASQSFTVVKSCITKIQVMRKVKV